MLFIQRGGYIDVSHLSIVAADVCTCWRARARVCVLVCVRERERERETERQTDRQRIFQATLTRWTDGIFPIEFETVMAGWPMVNIEGVTGYTLKINFVLENSADLDEMPHDVAFHLGFHCLSKYPS